MRKWTKSNKSSRTIAIVLFDSFSNHCLANTLEPFRAANKLANQMYYQWSTHSLDGKPVRSSSNLTLVPDSSLQEVPSCDYLMLVSSYDYKRVDNARTRLALQFAAKSSRNVVGLDTGAWLMATSSLLTEKRATIHVDELESFSETFLDVDVKTERFIIDGNRITCGGASAAFDLMMHLIGDHHGEKLRLDVESLLLKSDEQANVDYPAVQARSLIVARALKIMKDNVEGPLAIKAVCDRINTNQKELERAFQRDLGAAPQKVYRFLRLTRIKRLIETTSLPISEITLRGGYENPSAMTRAFVEEFQITPRELRGKIK